jgi:hypothetical protein
MMLLVMLQLFSLAQTPEAGAPTSIGPQVCQSYNTFESQHHCGPNGYFLGYGLRYCSRFFDKGLIKMKEINKLWQTTSINLMKLARSSCNAQGSVW